MSYYFAIIGTKDNPLFEYEFGTSKQGGDGVARFREDARHMNQFIVHSSLDIVEELQWTTGAMYLKSIDRFYTSHISCFLTPSNIKFLLLHNPDPNATPWQPSAATGSSAAAATSQPMSASTSSASYPPPSAAASNRASTASSNSIAANPTSPATEEAVRQFFADVYENWVKTVMNPFYTVNQPVKSPVFRGRVAAAGRKYL